MTPSAKFIFFFLANKQMYAQFNADWPRNHSNDLHKYNIKISTYHLQNGFDDPLPSCENLMIVVDTFVRWYWQRSVFGSKSIVLSHTSSHRYKEKWSKFVSISKNLFLITTTDNSSESTNVHGSIGYFIKSWIILIV